MILREWGEILLFPSYMTFAEHAREVVFNNGRRASVYYDPAYSRLGIHFLDGPEEHCYGFPNSDRVDEWDGGSH